jgi:DNA-binding NtrC family response regulator
MITLVVDIDAVFLSMLQPIVEAVGSRFVGATDFAVARQQLRELAPDVVITNLRLASFNGIHLALLAKVARPETRVLVYSAHHDRALAREARSAGAFYERREFLPYSIQQFLIAPLPHVDRRDTDVVDRRAVFRGGRRASDIGALRGAASM